MNYAITAPVVEKPTVPEIEQQFQLIDEALDRLTKAVSTRNARIQLVLIVNRPRSVMSQIAAALVRLGYQWLSPGYYVRVADGLEQTIRVFTNPDDPSCFYLRYSQR